MEDRQQIFSSFKNVFVNVLSVSAWHTVMPEIDNNEYILNTHLLQLRQQFLATAFLIAIIIPLNNAIIGNAGVQTGVTLLRLTDLMIDLLLTEPICNHARLGFPYLLSPGDEIHYQVHMHLLTYCS